MKCLFSRSGKSRFPNYKTQKCNINTSAIFLDLGETIERVYITLEVGGEKVKIAPYSQQKNQNGTQ